MEAVNLIFDFFTFNFWIFIGPHILDNNLWKHFSLQKGFNSWHVFICSSHQSSLLVLTFLDPRWTICTSAPLHLMRHLFIPFSSNYLFFREYYIQPLNNIIKVIFWYWGPYIYFHLFFGIDKESVWSAISKSVKLLQVHITHHYCTDCQPSYSNKVHHCLSKKLYFIKTQID